MRWESFACLGSTEISNGARVAAYINNVGVPEATMPVDCQCVALDEGYDTPTTDPAPWLESTRTESADFLGFYASNIVPQSSAKRSSTAVRRNGSQIGPLASPGRIVQVSGLMQSTSAEGMAYGEAWMREVLKGSSCVGGGCPDDDLTLLPACPSDSYDIDSAFRTLINVGLMDGPVFVQIQDLPECKVQQCSFVLQSTSQYMYHPLVRCLDDEPMGGSYGDPLDCSLITPEWMGEGTFIIDITSTDTSDVEDILIEGRISLDGSCPATGPNRSISPAWTYRIPALGPEDRIVIDGMRRQVLHYDASSKIASGGLGYFDFDGAWDFPDVDPCTTMCLEISALAGDANVTVDSVLRES